MIQILAASKTPTELVSLIIGIIGAICIGIYVLPQCVKTIKTKDTAGISLGMFVLSAVGAFLFVLSALINAFDHKGIETWLPLFIGNGCSCAASVIVLALKIRNLKWANRYNIPESKIPEHFQRIKEDIRRKKAAKKAAKQAAKADMEAKKEQFKSEEQQ